MEIDPIGPQPSAENLERASQGPAQVGRGHLEKSPAQFPGGGLEEISTGPGPTLGSKRPARLRGHRPP